MKKQIKKKMVLVLCVFGLIGVLSGCAGQQSKGEKDNSEAEFVKEGDIYTYTDTQNSPFEDSGLKINVKQGDDGYVKFIKTDLDGKETVEYYNFDNETKTKFKHYYVGAMGTSFDYTYDLEKNELVKVEDGNKDDVTQKTKDSGRWDKSAKTVDSDAKDLQEYFNTNYGMVVLDACTSEKFGK